MTGFSPKQERALKRKLDRRHVHSREVDGRSIDYVEGWFAIAQANAIFGFDGWDREMTHFERLYERSRNERTNCSYLARVRIRVRAGEAIVVREGTGWGSAAAANPAEAHERALKAAETDATKRALATFGNRFGLGLYDKDQNGVTAKKPTSGAAETARYRLCQPEGGVLADNLSPEGFCTGLRQLIEKMSNRDELNALLRNNEDTLARLPIETPNLKTSKGLHYAEVLSKLAKDRLAAFPSAPHREEDRSTSTSPLKPSNIAVGGRIDRSELTLATERRYRDKAHLQFVASQPCLVCGRQPSHAHHLTFAQKRGLALKVSDEFTVPLCALHHDDLHRSGPELDWWQRHGLEPGPVAAALWQSWRETNGAKSATIEYPASAMAAE